MLVCEEDGQHPFFLQDCADDECDEEATDSQAVDAIDAGVSNLVDKGWCHDEVRKEGPRTC